MRLWAARSNFSRNKQLYNFLSILFFLFLIDAILSYWVPNFVEGVVHNSFFMGLIISFSSVIGLIFDMVFSESLIGSSLKKVIWFLIGGIAAFIFTLGLSAFRPIILFLILAMASWGFYYDLFNFSSQQYVSETTSPPNRPLVWSIVSLVRNLAYFIGPIIAVKLLFNKTSAILISAVILLILAGGELFLSSFRQKSYPFQHRKVSFLAELEHWKVLFDRVWPLLTVSFILGLVDATYWTTGTLVTNNLAQKSNWGSLFLPLYILPFLLSGSFISKFQVKEASLSQIFSFLVFAGGLLACINFTPYLWWKLIIVFFSSILIAISWPLVNTVYTNLLVRMGRKREHLIGLSDSMLNLAYIFGPVLAGGLSSLVGNILTFAIIGLTLTGTIVILWILTPSRLRLPQKEIKDWDD